jgi:hypothetical protein
MLVRSTAIAIIGVFLLALSAQAEGLTVEGIVKDGAGRPIQGADVLIQTKDYSKVVKTDVHGHYRSDTLLGGNYKVTVRVNGSVQAAMVNAETRSAKSTKLDFVLSSQSAPPAKYKHMVWVAPEIGTHIGGGAWVEVDDKNVRPVQVAARTASNIKKLEKNALTLDSSIRNGVTCSCLDGGGSSNAGLAVGRTVSSYAGTHSGSTN